MQVAIIGLDIAKNVFQLHGADGDGTRRQKKNKTEPSHIALRTTLVSNQDREAWYASLA